MKSELVDKMATLITASLGLVAALAWNDAIKVLFLGPCGSENAGALCYLANGGPWIYAISVTLVAVLATIWISKISAKEKMKKKKKQ